jgi:hypothetical protein
MIFSAMCRSGAVQLQFAACFCASARLLTDRVELHQIDNETSWSLSKTQHLGQSSVVLTCDSTMDEQQQQSPRTQIQNRQFLLQPRTRTELELGCSKATVIRLEKEGRLTPIRLRKNGNVFHRVEDVQALIAGAT